MRISAVLRLALFVAGTWNVALAEEPAVAAGIGAVPTAESTEATPGRSTSPVARPATQPSTERAVHRDPTGTRPAAQAPVSPEQIRQWIADLTGDSFEQREEASRCLESAGCAGVGPLVAATGADKLELVGRAVRALGGIARTGDDQAFDLAQAALEALADSKNRSAAWRADLALQAVAERRQTRALARVAELGALVKIESTAAPSIAGFSPTNEPRRPAMQIVVDSRWKAGDAGLVYLYRIADVDRGGINGLPWFQALYVTKGSQLSQEGIADLKRKAPHLIIDPRSDAMLGVKAHPYLSPVRVTSVVEGSAAHKAGMRDGDEILRYDGENVIDFTQLAAITERHVIGDKVVLEIVRDREIVTLEAVLGEWK